ncbi:hypothetical protein GCM10007415_40650 [Parapedobacter pyrenivorans]|uniref:Macroglobulin domain-containing protein n=2 Tax=Parapedobacter pyrenivorans TaxID=1305674 RepID=A0A917I007_9SPHI|nr:hypothetical protein GCM10007415_40650 [Parapedobacter pyrenivorans]
MGYAHIIRLLLFSLVSVLMSAKNLHAQEIPVISAAAYAEKIYLQTDAEVYTADQTIWFTAIVVSSQDLHPSILSGVLHVELIASDERVIQRKRIQLAAGRGAGSFQLEKTYPQGVYQIRAYTEWNKNFGSDFIARCYVNLFPSTAEIERTPITAFQLREKEPNHFWLYAQLIPTMIDETHKKDLTAFLTVDQHRDTLVVKGARGNYLLDYPLPADATLATLTIETQNGARYTRTVLAKPDSLEVQFFAESGQLVLGIQSRIGIRIRNATGKGVATSGFIVDSRGDTVAPFRTNHLGIGSVKLTPLRGLTYNAVLAPRNAGKGTDRYPLPAVSDTGWVLAVEPRDTAVHLELRTNGSLADTLQVEVSSRGVPYYQIKGVAKNGLLATDLPYSSLPEGIIAFQAMDKQLQPVAMRLFFNRPNQNRLQVQASMDNPSYDKREKGLLSVRVSDDAGRPVKAALTVRVMNKDQFGRLPTGRQTLQSRILLDSELQGGVNEPGYYFLRETPYADIDALLLTHTSRYRYLIPLQDTFHYANEPQPYITGRVSGAFSKRGRDGVGITLLTFGQTKGMDAQDTDNLGRFAFGLGEEYVDSLAILLQSTNKKGKNQNYTISLDERIPPEVEFDQHRLISQVDSVVAYVAKQRQERAQRELSYKLASGEILLEEVEVVRKALSPQQQQVQDRYGEADVVIAGKAIQDKEEKWSYGLYSVLLFNFPEEIRIQRVGGNGGYLRAQVVGNEPTLVVIDGIPVPGYSYELIPNIPPSEVKSVELIKFARGFSTLYLETYPEASPMSAPMTGSVVAIYTHAGKGLYAARKPVGLLQATVPVYSPVTPFQAVSHKPDADDDRRPDLRTLLHWVDSLGTDEQGTCSTSFYHSDVAGQTVVIVEAMTDDGRIGYEQLVYEVKSP